MINKAYQTITDPLKRGFYMLEIKGAAFSEEGISTDKSLLLNIMEINEEISILNCRRNVAKLHAKIQNKISELLS